MMLTQINMATAPRNAAIGGAEQGKKAAGRDKGEDRKSPSVEVEAHTDYAGKAKQVG